MDLCAIVTKLGTTKAFMNRMLFMEYIFVFTEYIFLKTKMYIRIY